MVVFCSAKAIENATLAERKTTLYCQATNRNRYGTIMELWLMASRRMSTESADRRHLNASKINKGVSRG